MNAGQLRRLIVNELTPRYGGHEAQAMALLIFHHLKGWDRTQLIVNSDFEASQRMLADTHRILERLGRDEPLQYILGEARFYGMDLHVEPGVLIPRPETAELVDIIADRFRDRSDLRVLDAGCGSGAIAIALARNLPFSHVTALDISGTAIKVTRDNAERLRASVATVQADIFQWEPAPESLDIVVSNPPYIPEEDSGTMDRSVRMHEPRIALMVPDDDPLKFYRRITDVAARGLKPGGMLYFEIYPRFADEMRRLMTGAGFGSVEIRRDSYGKERFAYGVWKEA